MLSRCKSLEPPMSHLGLGRAKTFGSAEFLAFEVVVFGIGYALIAAVSGRTPIMLITLVIL